MTIDLAELIEHPFVWPGGYERFAVVDDGEILCWKCVRDNPDEVHTDGEPDGWKVIALDHMANTDEQPQCAHCYRRIT